MITWDVGCFGSMSETHLQAANQFGCRKELVRLVEGLIAKDVIQDVTRHWIVNSFTCTTGQKGVLEAIQEIPGAAMSFLCRSCPS